MSYSSEVLADSPAAYWKLDETSGTSAADSSGNGRSLTHTNGPTVNQASLLGDGSGKSVSYDRTNDYSTIASAAWMDTTGSITVEARAQPTAAVLTAGGFIASRWLNSLNQTWLLGVTSAGKAQAAVWTGGAQRTATGATTLTGGTNYTLALRYNSSTNTLDVLVNGSVDGTASTTGSFNSPITAATDLGRAAGANGSGLSWGGLIDEVSVTFAALSNGRMAARHAAAIAAASYETGVGNTAGVAATPVDAAGVGNGAGVSASPAAASGAGNQAGVAASPVATAGVGNQAGWASSTEPDTQVAGIGNPAGWAGSAVPSVGMGNPAGLAAQGYVTAGIGNRAGWGASGSASLDAAESYAEAGADADAPILVALDTAEAHAAAGADAVIPTLFETDPVESYAESWADAYDKLEVTVDPVTGRPQYSLKVVETNGDVITELSDAALGIATRALNGRGGMSFALGSEDDQQEHVPQFSELQLWRGGRMVRGAWFVVPDPDDQIDADVTGFDCLGLSYYFERRLIGKERPELLKNGGFEQRARYWNFGYEAGSNAEAPPRWEITDEACEGGKALRLFAQDKVVTVKAVAETAAIFYGNRPYASEALSAGFQPGGEQKIRDLLNQANPPKNATITVEGHTADADGGTGFALSLRRANAAKAVILAARPDLTVNTVGKGETEPVDPRHNETAYRKNRRVVIKGSFTQTKVGHRQYSWQSFEYTVDPSNREPVEFDVQVQGRIDQFDGPSKDGWMLYTDVRPVADPTKVNNDDYVDIDETSPRGVWMGLHGLPKAPADGNTYKVTLRLYPTAGATSFDQASVMPNLKLHFWQKDPYDVIGGLVAHAQDTAYGKSNLKIGIHGARSGFVLDRAYEWKEGKKVSEAIDEIVRSDNGPDANIEVSARIRRLTVAPKQGRRTGITLATDGHVGDATIVAFSASVDGDDVTTTARVQSSWSGGGMTEVVERLARPDGLVLESLFQAEQDAPASTVRQQARTAVRYGRADVVTRVVMSNQDTTLLMEQLTIGDVVWIEAHNARVNASGWYRIIQMDLDPNNDQLAFDVAPEV